LSRVAVFGAGYVGLVTGACFAELGHDVVVRDVDAAKVGALQAGQVPIYEPGLEERMQRNRERLRFTLDVGEAIEGAEVVYVAVGTPPTYSGDADLSAVWTVVDELPAVAQRLVVVMKSTVPVGTGTRVRARLDGRGLGHVGYASNPEFTAEGTAVNDFLHPDRIVIGAFEERDADVVEELHRGIEAPVVRSDVASAEMIKLAANAALMARISFINEIANVCEHTGADVVRVAEGVGLDRRIGASFLRAGVGYGGSCLLGSELVFVEATDDDDDGIRTLAEAFDDQSWVRDEDGVEIADPDGLNVLAWREGETHAEYLEATAITRRRYEGPILHVRHPLARISCTPDHPFVVADGAGGTVVKLARDLVAGDQIPGTPAWRTKNLWRGRAGGKTTAVEQTLDVSWDSVKGTVDGGVHSGYVYSLEIPAAGTFVTSGGVIVHNCFPKDSLALKQLAANSGYHFQLLNAVIEVNELQKRRVIGKLQRHLGSLRDRKVALLGLAFKPDTDDMREAPSLVLGGRLLAEGADVTAWDPIAQIDGLLHGVEQVGSVEEALEGADAAVLVTEWRQLRDVDWAAAAGRMRRALLIDGRNMLDPEAMRAAGFKYEGVGRAADR
jgi:UDP-glucose 6-dehydrogenase